MAQMGYGYGSEFQLLRFLGHHRNFLETEICKQAEIKKGTFNWLDFGFANRERIISGDKEYCGLSFLESIPFIEEVVAKNIIANYTNYKIKNISTWQYWDAVFTLDKTIYLVEAKAHVDELLTPIDRRDKRKSNDAILNYMKDNLPNLPVSDIWLNDYYQIANRLATTAFLQKQLKSEGASAKTLCIFFTNGFSKPVLGERNKIIEMDNTDNPTSICDFEKAINKEMDTLGITEEQVASLLTKPVFIDANPLKRGKTNKK